MYCFRFFFSLSYFMFTIHILLFFRSPRLFHENFFLMSASVRARMCGQGLRNGSRYTKKENHQVFSFMGRVIVTSSEKKENNCERRQPCSAYFIFVNHHHRHETHSKRFGFFHRLFFAVFSFFLFFRLIHSLFIFSLSFSFGCHSIRVGLSKQKYTF